MVLVIAQDGERKASGCKNEREVKCFLSFQKFLVSKVVYS